MGSRYRSSERVSTGDQKLALQQDALNTAGCERTFDDHASGAKIDRPDLAEALAYLRAGDTLVVKLDRLGRSMSRLIEKVGELSPRGSYRPTYDTVLYRALAASGGKFDQRMA